MTRPRANHLFVVGLILGLSVLAALIFLPLLTPILLGALLAYLIHPLHRRLANLLRGSPRLAAALLLVLVIGALIVPLSWGAVVLVREVRDVTPEDAAAQLDATVAPLARLLGLPENGTYGRDLALGAAAAAADWARAHVGDLFGIVTRLVVGAFLLGFVLFYSLVDGPRMVAWIGDVLPLPRAQYDELVGNVRTTLDAVFLGQLVSAIAQGILATIAFAIFGVPLFLLWGVLTAALAVLPFLGAFVVWVPIALWLLVTGHTNQAIGLALFCLILVANVDNVVQPLLVGRRARVHPVVVLVGVLGGIAAFGFVGFIVGPLVLALLVAVLRFWREDYLPAYGGEFGKHEPPPPPTPPPAPPSPPPA